MDMIAAYNDLGSYRCAAAICGVYHKTVKRAVAGQRAAPASTACCDRPQVALAAPFRHGSLMRGWGQI